LCAALWREPENKMSRMLKFDRKNYPAAVGNVIAGSCTPATALLTLVRENQITHLDAQNAYSERCGAFNDIFAAARSESEYQRYNDI
jgi:hypothetical protein